jgi:hypothetical protein
MKNYYYEVVLLMAVFFIQACATTGGLEKRLDEKLSQENDLKTTGDLNTQASQIIQSATDLNTEQKEKLKSLRTTTQSKISEISLQTLKLRSILIKDLVETQYDEDEVDLIKERIHNLDRERTTVLFKAIEQANEIVGRQAQSRAAIMHDFWLEDMDRVR